MMVGGTNLKQLFANIFQNEMEAFELKMKACMQERDKTVQTLQQEAGARETKFEELGKKLETEIVLFRKICRDSTKKDTVIDILEQRVLENNLANSKLEKKLSILITMIREERAMVRLLSQNKVQEDQEIADIRSSLEESVISFSGECGTTADLDTRVTDGDNDDALTNQIELSESLEMEKLLESNEDKEDKDKDGKDLDTSVNHGIEKFANIQETEDEITHTADTISIMIDTLLGKLGDKKDDRINVKFSSIKKESKPQVETEHLLTDKMFDIKEPAQKKLKDKNIDQLIFPTSHIEKTEKQFDFKNQTMNR